MDGSTNASNVGGTVGTDTKPIKIVDGKAVAVTNDLVSSQSDGSLIIDLNTGNIARNLILKSQAIERGVYPVGASNYVCIEFYDKNGSITNNTRVGEVGYQQDSNGDSSMYIRAYNISGTKHSALKLITHGDDTTSLIVTDTNGVAHIIYTNVA